MSHTGESDRLMSDINVTPFVDVMLVLLIVFMVAAPMMIEGVEVSLPQATSKPMETEQEQLIVSVNKKGEIFLNDYEVALDELGEKLNLIIKGQSDREVYLRADKEIPYGIVVRVMSEIKNIGVERLGMVTEPQDLDEKSTAKAKS
ncbi:MAG: protein TolR [Desulfobacterales bacterium]